MVAKKHTSKRFTLRHRYKVIKRVAEHKRKLKKFARKNPHLVRKPVDPGIPNHWPFKGELLELIEKENERKESEKDIQRSIAKQNKLNHANNLTQKASMEMMEKNQSHSIQNSSVINQLKLIKNQINESQLILYVIDSRDPMGSINENTIETIQSNEIPIIFIFNKIDLIPSQVTRSWLKYFNEFYQYNNPTFGIYYNSILESEEFNYNNEEHNKPAMNNKAVINSKSKSTLDMIKSNKKFNKLKEKDICYGINGLFTLINSYSMNNSNNEETNENNNKKKNSTMKKGTKSKSNENSSNELKSINISVIGYNNVGKSTLINNLLRQSLASVSPYPGFTKQINRYKINSNLYIFDTPGIPINPYNPGPHINLPLDHYNPLDLIQSLLSVFTIQQLRIPLKKLIPENILQLLLTHAHKEENDDENEEENKSNQPMTKAQKLKEKSELIQNERNKLKYSILLIKKWNSTEIPYFTQVDEETKEKINKEIKLNNNSNNNNNKSKAKKNNNSTTTVDAAEENPLELIISESNEKSLKEVVRKFDDKEENYMKLDFSLMKAIGEEEENEGDEDDEDEDDEEDEEGDEEMSDDDEEEESAESESEEAPELVRVDKNGKPVKNQNHANNSKPVKSAPASVPVSAPSKSLRNTNSKKSSGGDDYDFDQDY